MRFGRVGHVLTSIYAVARFESSIVDNSHHTLIGFRSDGVYECAVFTNYYDRESSYQAAVIAPSEGWSLAAIFTRSARESAFIFCITLPRCAFTVISLIPSSPATCLFNRPETTNTITCRSRCESEA